MGDIIITIEETTIDYINKQGCLPPRVALLKREYLDYKEEFKKGRKAVVYFNGKLEVIEPVLMN